MGGSSGARWLRGAPLAFLIIYRVAERQAIAPRGHLPPRGGKGLRSRKECASEGFMAPGIQLRLIGTSDLHAYIYPYDYYRDRRDETVGLAKTAALISAARAEAVNSLLLDNGDF